MKPEKKQSPEQMKKEKFFQSLQKELHDQVKILTESVNSNNEDVAILQESFSSLVIDVESQWRELLGVEESVSRLKSHLSNIYRLMWIFIIIILIILILSATNIFLFRVK